MSELLDITHARCWRAGDEYFVAVPYAIIASTTRYRSFTLSVVRRVLAFIRSLTIRN